MMKKFKEFGKSDRNRNRNVTFQAPALSQPISESMAHHRWKKAMSAVLEKKNTTQMNGVSRTRDRLGEQMTKMFNKEFVFQPDKEENVPILMDAPLFSKRNLQHWIKQLKTNLPLSTETLKLLIRIPGKVSEFILRDCQSFVTFLKVFCLSVLVTAGGMAFAMNVAIHWIIRHATMFIYLSVSLLFDPDELKGLLPRPIKYLLKCLGVALSWVDNVLLNGRRMAGREWNADAFAFGSAAMEAKSRQLSLWKCPPPSLSQNGSRSALWSQDTANHIAAIEFCYMMLRNDHKKKTPNKPLASPLAKKGSKRELFGERRAVSEQIVPRDRGLVREESYKLLRGSPGSRPRRLRIRTRANMTSPTEEIELIGSSPRRPQVSSAESPQITGSTVGSGVFHFCDDDTDGSASTSGDRSCASPIFRLRKVPSEGSLVSDTVGDMNWMDVGANIGIRLLNSEHVQKAMTSQDTAERILDISKKVEKNFAAPRSDVVDWQESMITFHSGPEGIQQESVSSFDGMESIRTRTLVPPVHSMWTSASAVALQSETSTEEESIEDVPRVISPTVDALLDDDILRPLSVLASTKPAESTSEWIDSFVGNSELELSTNPSLSVDDGSLIQDKLILVSDLKETDTSDNNTKVELSPLQEPRGLVTLPSKSAFSSRSLATQVSSKIQTRRAPLLPGVKMAVPIFPFQPCHSTSKSKVNDSVFQMATVVSSKRIFVYDHADHATNDPRHANCLQITVYLDKSFLRDGRFAEMTLRIMDSWGNRFMPRHSKFPIGSCVATTFGVGVLVGWRVEDDVHLVRSLWQRRGQGSANAYLNRNALHSVVEAAVGFPVETKFGMGTVLSYVNGGRQFREGRYFVLIKEPGRHKGHLLEFNRCDILQCKGPEFIPVLEFIREAAQYQIQLDSYNAALQRRMYDDTDEKKWRSWSIGFQIIWAAFLKAVKEDTEFDSGVNDFFSSVIQFLERLDNPEASKKTGDEPSPYTTKSQDPVAVKEDDKEGKDEQDEDSGDMDELGENNQPNKPNEDGQNNTWIMDEVFGGVFALQNKRKRQGDPEAPSDDAAENQEVSSFPYERAYGVVRTLMRTVSIARVESSDQPNLKLAMAICYEFLQFVRTVLKVQQKNVSPTSLAVWKRAIEEIYSTFGPVKERLVKIGKGIAERVKRHGNRAKVRILRFVDIVLLDETLLSALERSEWDLCRTRLEIDLIKARIIDEGSREHYRRTVNFVCNHFFPASRQDGGAAARNNEKLIQLAKVVKWLASPRRSILTLVQSNQVLELMERIFVRVFRREPGASRMLTIHASGIHTLRHLRILKDFTIAGKLWMPMLDAADDEFAWSVSKMSQGQASRDILMPLSKLFSLCVAQFHKISDGNLMSDWMDFLLEDEAVELIHEIDVKLILALEALTKDTKEVMEILPYYKSIDDDILNLMDEVDLDALLMEASEAIVDKERLAEFILEKSTIAVEKFLDYLPKMSIPVQQRELGDGWALTCRGEDGGDLTLSDVNIKRENLRCQVMGGETIFFPMFGDDDASVQTQSDASTVSTHSLETPSHQEVSILNHIRQLILQAQKFGCWQPGVGGVGQPPTDRYVASVLKGLPVSTVLNTGIELWRNLEIDDDELLEIAIRDVSYQIQLQQEREEGVEVPLAQPLPAEPAIAEPIKRRKKRKKGAHHFLSEDGNRKRFNPRVDPTILLLEMKKLTLNLDRFKFRIEKINKTIFDPVFEGWGSLSVQNVSIKLRVECRKERLNKLGQDMTVAVLQCRELDVTLEKVRFRVKDTGADWILNKAVSHFADDITEVMENNLKEQVQEQVQLALDTLNSYFLMNPELMLGILGITMDDLEENVVWV